MTDHHLEQQIQAKGLTAPRVTPEDVEASIASEHYYTAEHGVEGAVNRGELWARHAAEWPGDTPMPYITHCVIVMRNGHKIVGVNTGSVSNENFDPELARELARKDAISQIWPLLGYALRDRLAADSAPRNPVESKLTSIVRAFVEEHEIGCAETIYQSDRVIENAYGLVENLIDVVGYFSNADDDAC